MDSKLGSTGPSASGSGSGEERAAFTTTIPPVSVASYDSQDDSAASQGLVMDADQAEILAASGEVSPPRFGLGLDRDMDQADILAAGGEVSPPRFGVYRFDHAIGQSSRKTDSTGTISKALTPEPLDVDGSRTRPLSVESDSSGPQQRPSQIETSSSSAAFTAEEDILIMEDLRSGGNGLVAIPSRRADDVRHRALRLYTMFGNDKAKWKGQVWSELEVQIAERGFKAGHELWDILSVLQDRSLQANRRRHMWWKRLQGVPIRAVAEMKDVLRENPQTIATKSFSCGVTLDELESILFDQRMDALMKFHRTWLRTSKTTKGDEGRMEPESSRQGKRKGGSQSPHISRR